MTQKYLDEQGTQYLINYSISINNLILIVQNMNSDILY